MCYTIHSLAEDNPKHGKMLKFIMKAAAMISIYCCGKNILTVSNSKAKEIKSRYGKRCTVVPCGVNLPLEDINSDILSRFGIISGHYYLTIGRIDPIKNLDILIKAFTHRGNSDYQLVIAGNYNNDHGAYLTELAQNNNNILFVGSVMGADKEELLKNCFVNCLVSSSEGMPISLLEAMAYGKPCIVSDIPAINEILQKDWAMWCSVRDVKSLCRQFETAEDNRAHLLDVSSKMAQYIKDNHTWNNIAAKYLTYLNSL